MLSSEAWIENGAGLNMWTMREHSGSDPADHRVQNHRIAKQVGVLLASMDQSVQVQEQYLQDHHTTRKMSGSSGGSGAQNLQATSSGIGRFVTRSGVC